MGTSRYFSINSATRCRLARDDGTSRAAPRRKNSKHAFCGRQAGPTRCIVSVTTASVVRIGPIHRDRTATQSECRASLRSSSATNAPVSRRSSPGTSQSLQQVVSMTLAQVWYAAGRRAEQVPHQFDWPALHSRISFVQELFQGEADHIRPPAPCLPGNPVELRGQIGRHSKGQLPLHSLSPVVAIQCNALRCSCQWRTLARGFRSLVSARMTRGRWG